jgi:glutathione S-transferase
MLMRACLRAGLVSHALISPAAAQGDTPAQAAIRAALTQWMADFNAGRAEKVCDLFARDLVAQYRGQPERGWDALCDLLKRSLADRDKRYSYALAIKEILVEGDLGVPGRSRSAARTERRHRPSRASTSSAARPTAAGRSPATSAMNRRDVRRTRVAVTSCRGHAMAEYQLYCFAQSGNSYRCALMLNLIDADWEPVWVDFFAKGEPRTPEFRTNVNEMGEAPVLAHGKRKLSQSGVILSYLADRSGKFKPEGEDERLEALRWIIFDNQKVNGFLGPYRFLRNFAKPPGDPAVLAFLKGRIDNNLAIVDKRLASRPFVLGARPTIADLSLVAYLYYPAEEFGFDIPAQHKHIAVWLDRIKALPGWKHPYDLMPGHPLPGR